MKSTLITFRCCLFIILLVGSMLSIAQSNYTLPADPTNKNVTPPPPDAWQFMKYGEYPVSKETGATNISIPIHTIVSGDLSVPISLSYHTGGIRVDDVSSWVGLGWVLNAGGMISRTIKGQPDENQGAGLLYMPINTFDQNGVLDFTNFDIGTDVDYDIAMKMRRRELDSEPDVFNYNIGGASGKFYLDPATKSTTGSVFYCKGVTQPKSDIDITVKIENLSANDRRITEVVAITPDGTKYFFDITCHYSDGAVFGNSSWYLSRMESYTGKEYITFYYKDFGNKVTDYYTVESSSIKFNRFVLDTSPTPVTTSYQGFNSTYIGMKHIDRIEFATGKVVFNSVDDRIDDYERRLSSIDIYSNRQTFPIKSFVLGNTTYFETTGSNIPSFNKRLKLSSIQEIGSNGQTSPPYRFTYLETGNYKLPPRKAFSQDYWGFYNGKGLNQSSIPKIDLGLVDPEIDVVTGDFILQGYTATHNIIGSADREPDANYMAAGMIQKVEYPTGGSTVFEFEANTVKNSYQKQNTNYIDSIYGAAVYPGQSPREKITTFSPSKNFIAKLELHIVDIYNYGNVATSGAVVELYDITESTPVAMMIRESQIVDEVFYVYVEEGKQYRLRAKSNFDNIVSNVNIRYEVPPDPLYQYVTENWTVGGLRVSKIINYDKNSDIITEKNYDYDEYTYTPNGTPAHTITGFSSGRYNAERLPTAKSFLSYSETHFSGGPMGPGELNWDLIYSSTGFPANQMGFPSGSGVTYEFVTETITGSNAGKTISQFEVANKDQLFTGHNNTFMMDRSWLRGQPINEHYYDENGQIVKEVQFGYETVNYPELIIKGVKIDKYVEVIEGIGGVCQVEYAGGGVIFCTPQKIRSLRYNHHRISAYTHPIQWRRLKTQTTIQDGISTTSTFSYDSDNRHTQVVKARTQDSKGRINETSIQYAMELNETTLLSKNMISIPLFSKVSFENEIVGGSKVSYSHIDGLYVPSSIEEILTDGTYRQVKEVISVNEIGRVDEFKSSDGTQKVMLWGYNNQFPIAEVSNASLNQVAFSSFEGGNNEGGWNFNLGCTDPSSCISSCPDSYQDPYGYQQCADACHNTYNNCLINQAGSIGDSKTGERCYQGSSVSKTGLPAGNYVISFWAKKTGGTNGNISITGTGLQSVTSTDWEFFKITLNSITNVTVALSNVRIDDLRLYPQGSLMTTFTANPMVGITTITDQNEVTQYFEYDNMNRLKLVRDHNGDIVKKNNYNYHLNQSAY